MQGGDCTAELTLEACATTALVFACTTKNHKYVEVCDRGAHLRYLFGKPGQPAELALMVPRSAASSYQWDGFSSGMTYTVNIPNGNTTYSIFWSAQRDPDAEEPVSAGIDVRSNGPSAAIVECQTEGIVQNIEGIVLKAAEY